MKTLLLTLSAVILFSCKPTQSEFSEIAKTTNLQNIDGSQIAFQDILKKHAGKPILIEFWASWCSDCVKNMPKLKELQANNPNVDYVFISADKTTDAWKNGIEKHQVKGDNYMMNDEMKGVFGKSIDLDWIPRYIIIDKNGKIVTFRAIETDFEAVNTTLKKL
jgi:thiol-disulfide isomerase/thioredoxin